jgi:hypothetical protein
LTISIRQQTVIAASNHPTDLEASLARQWEELGRIEGLLQRRLDKLGRDNLRAREKGDLAAAEAIPDEIDAVRAQLKKLAPAVKDGQRRLMTLRHRKRP